MLIVEVNTTVILYYWLDLEKQIQQEEEEKASEIYYTFISLFFYTVWILMKIFLRNGTPNTCAKGSKLRHEDIVYFFW